MTHLDPSVVPVVRECAQRTQMSVTKMQDFYLSEIFFSLESLEPGTCLLLDLT